MKPFIEQAAKELWDAERNRQPVHPISETYADITIEDAYAIQQQVKEWKLNSGARLIGRKIGLTSLAMQHALNVHEPDFGSLYDNMLLPEGSSVPYERFLQPKIEAELAFVMKKDLQGPVHFLDVLQATAYVVPAFEIIDSRVRDWKINIKDTVADNASSGALVLGSRSVPVDDLNLRLIGLVLECNGQIVDTAAGAAVLGHPAEAVAWLCNKLAAFGEGLKAGDIVLSGSFTKAYIAQPGYVFHAHFDRIGTVQVGFGHK
ncbi:2-keto-4-pentenoate hydratase [Fodinisporobacter ferrooxydans]|uniref:2-keto-4-pentenoate hydratase n=1 Tax=Fodinisporobacter ferrooxydans TaxID=2901836 RepID=A0ABY4CRM3_9BACL|nr:2-keto-4-pentenoate hydratase [Alicyclobacillaceae bacterium MYW30-H2]